MLCKIINSQAPASTRVSSPPPESSKKRPHEAEVSLAKRDHDRQDPPDFRPPPPEFNSSQQHLQNPIPPLPRSRWSCRGQPTNLHEADLQPICPYSLNGLLASTGSADSIGLTVWIFDL
ncbi:hypothetical protein WN943_016419 [Citrus x changshan-huyou]